MDKEEQFWAGYRQKIKDAAEATAEYERLEKMTKVIKSELMLASGVNSVSAQERDAYAAPEYKAHIERLAESRSRMEWLKGELRLMQDRLDWQRTIRADKRAEMTLR